LNTSKLGKLNSASETSLLSVHICQLFSSLLHSIGLVPILFTPVTSQSQGPTNLITFDLQ
jgi:hypothetical protein